MFKKRSKDPEMNNLSEREAALRNEMERLKSFITEGAEKEMIEQVNTMPPPDDLDQRARQAIHIEQVMSNKEIRNIKRQQAKGILLFILLSCAIASLSAWVLRIYAEHAN